MPYVKPPTKKELSEYVYSMFGRIRDISVISRRHDTGTYVFKLDETEDSSGRQNNEVHLLKLYVPWFECTNRKKKFSEIFDREIQITSHLGTFHRQYHPEVRSSGTREARKDSQAVRKGRLPRQAKYLLTEYFHGTGLDKLIDEGNLSFETKLDIAIHLAHALNRMHKLEGITHQDVKPENIILDKNKIPKLIDFGTADYIGDVPLCRTGMLTAAYCSPEQVEQVLCQKPIHINEPGTDIYCYGLVMYELFSGEHVHEEALSKINLTTNLLKYFMSRPPEKLKSTGYPDIDKIIGRAIKPKNQRYLGMEDIIYDLEKIKPKEIILLE